MVDTMNLFHNWLDFTHLKKKKNTKTFEKTIEKSPSLKMLKQKGKKIKSI